MIIILFNFQIITFTLSVAHADIGLKLRQQQQQQGYNYQVPQTSYGVPSYQVGSNAGDYNSGYAGIGANTFNNVQGSSQGPGFGQNTRYQSAKGVAGGQYSPLSSGVSQSNFQVLGAAQGAYQSYNQYETSNKYQEHYNNQVQQQPPQIFKHFYIHSAPEEPEVARPRQPVALPPPQKHYKIIFIKTPSQPASAPPYIPVPPQNEEKTIVYVLVEKPEEQPDIVIPKAEPKPPSKPEVFFIKYNSKQDSQSVINNIVTDHNNKDDTVTVGDVVANGAAITGGSSQYTQASGSGQYSQAGGSGDSGFSLPGATGQYSQSAAGSFGQSYSQSVGSSSSLGVGNTGSKTLSLETTDSNVAGGVDDSGTSTGLSSAAVSTASNSNFDGGNLISTSQGVPHETYGTPAFRV